MSASNMPVKSVLCDLTYHFRYVISLCERCQFGVKTMTGRTLSKPKTKRRTASARTEVAALAQDSEGGLPANLKLVHLKMIVSLEDCLQISAAASVLNMSQPAASRMLAEMQSILGVPLFSRVARGVLLTPYGRAFARQARTLLLQLRQVTQEISDLRTGHGGTVSVGAVVAPAILLAVPAINKIRQSYPNMKVGVQVETSSVLARDLLASRHDFIIARIPDELDPRLFNTRQIGIEKACLIVRRGHPLTNCGPIRLPELSRYDWVFEPSGSIMRRAVERLFVSHNVPLPNCLFDTTSTLLSMIMVCRTDAIAPVGVEAAEFLVDQRGMGSDVEILPIETEITVGPFALIENAQRSLTPTAKLLYDLILAEAKRTPFLSHQF